MKEISVAKVELNGQPLTLSGKVHEFLDAARNDTIWKKAKGIITEKMGSTSFDVLKDLLIKTSITQLGL